eukprot:Em0007g1472a
MGAFRRTAVCGGTNFDGEPLYVARINLPSGPTPGKMAPSFRIAHAGYGGEEHYSSNYEVLTNPKRKELKWEGTTRAAEICTSGESAGPTECSFPEKSATDTRRATVPTQEERKSTRLTATS